MTIDVHAMWVLPEEEQIEIFIKDSLIILQNSVEEGRYHYGCTDRASVSISVKDAKKMVKDLQESIRKVEEMDQSVAEYFDEQRKQGQPSQEDEVSFE
jgi:hypothetical protein